MCSSPRNGPHGYGAVTKTLHWAVFATLAPQFAVGYLLDVDDGGRGRGRGRGGEDGYEPFGDDALVTVHVVLGATVPLLQIAAQVVLHAAFAAHVGLVLKHQLVDRDHLLGRML
ncbi:hypothetical protein ACF090_09385 [Streptomyces sp. NPDC014892]|uniref:hypothetical protein n=1 Tax=Streptomyces sp. NPDC014892 TaxID=3364930 RepID=UPI0036FCB959